MNPIYRNNSNLNPPMANWSYNPGHWTQNPHPSMPMPMHNGTYFHRPYLPPRIPMRSHPPRQYWGQQYPPSNNYGRSSGPRPMPRFPNNYQQAQNSHLNSETRQNHNEYRNFHMTQPAPELDLFVFTEESTDSPVNQSQNFSGENGNDEINIHVSTRTRIGFVTSITGDLGFVGPEIFFHKSKVLGPVDVKVGDKVLVQAEAVQIEEMPRVKWNCNLVQLVDMNLSFDEVSTPIPFSDEVRMDDSPIDVVSTNLITVPTIETSSPNIDQTYDFNLKDQVELRSPYESNEEFQFILKSEPQSTDEPMPNSQDDEQSGQIVVKTEENSCENSSFKTNSNIQPNEVISDPKCSELEQEIKIKKEKVDTEEFSLSVEETIISTKKFPHAKVGLEAPAALISPEHHNLNTTASITPNIVASPGLQKQESCSLPISKPQQVKEMEKVKLATENSTIPDPIPEVQSENPIILKITFNNTPESRARRRSSGSKKSAQKNENRKVTCGTGSAKLNDSVCPLVEEKLALNPIQPKIESTKRQRYKTSTETASKHKKAKPHSSGSSNSRPGQRAKFLEHETRIKEDRRKLEKAKMAKSSKSVKNKSYDSDSPNHVREHRGPSTSSSKGRISFIDYDQVQEERYFKETRQFSPPHSDWEENQGLGFGCTHCGRMNHTRDNCRFLRPRSTHHRRSENEAPFCEFHQRSGHSTIACRALNIPHCIFCGWNNHLSSECSFRHNY